MVRQELVDYVKANLKKGFSEKDIKEKFVNSGIDEDETNRIIDIAKKEVKPMEKIMPEKPIGVMKEEAEKKGMEVPEEKPKKTSKWLYILIILILLLVVGGVYYYLFMM